MKQVRIKNKNKGSFGQIWKTVKLKFCFFWEKLKTTCVMMDLGYLIKFVEVVEIIWLLLPKFDQEWWGTSLIEFHTTNSFMTKCRSCQLIGLIFFIFFNPHHDPWIRSKVSCSVKHRILKILIVFPPSTLNWPKMALVKN